MFTVSIIRAMCITQDFTYTMYPVCVCVHVCSYTEKPGHFDQTRVNEHHQHIRVEHPDKSAVAVHSISNSRTPVSCTSNPNSWTGWSNHPALIALMVGTVSTTETSFNIYQSTRRNIPQDNLLHSITVFTKTQDCNLFWTYSNLIHVKINCNLTLWSRSSSK
jgi:hypothetical protein